MLSIDILAKKIESFNGIIELIDQYTPNDILNCVAERNNINVSVLAAKHMGGNSKGGTSGAYYFILKDLKDNLPHYIWLYDNLADKKSKEVFENLLRFRIIPSLDYLKMAYDTKNPQYFDPEIITIDENEVFVDCGGFTGDTVLNYLKYCGKYRRIYTYEPLLDNFRMCTINLEQFKNIVITHAGVGKQKTEEMWLSKSSSSSSFVTSSKSENKEAVGIISLDDDIQEPVTFIKMDIEGFEIEGILGAKEHIRKNSPKLAICLYHFISDIWEIPRLINIINPNYSFYIRHYREDENWETVLYAIPKKSSMCHHEQNKKLGVYTLSANHNDWTNQHLLKGCCLVPYMLYKNFGYDATLVGVKNGDYPYLDEHLNGLKMDFLPNSEDDNTFVRDMIEYINCNYKKMDILTLHGFYSTYKSIVPRYRELRPDGKIFIGLDANSAWVDRVLWNKPDFINFLNQCNVIGVSGRKLQRHLSRKWPNWIFEYIPNGFFDGVEKLVEVNPDIKENIILTVGRIGTKQKANDILLEAFADISCELPDWKLHLVGSIEPSFNAYIHSYFEKYPHLINRVIFKGLIESKSELYSEYSKAKIFALTSIFEAAPNAITEALNHGCYIITSDTDASVDFTNHNSIGSTFSINNISELQDILIKICNQQNFLSENFFKIIDYARKNYDWDIIIKRLHHLLVKL